MLATGIRGLIFISTFVGEIIITEVIEIIVGIIVRITGLIIRDATFPPMSVEDIVCGGTGAGRENTGRRKEDVEEN